MDLLLQQTPPLDDILLLRHPFAAAAAGVAWWLTVLAAAVGFWRIRSFASQKSTNVPVTATNETVYRLPPPPPSVDLPAASPTASCPTGLGTPKARFTSYYSFDDGDNDVMAGFEKEEEEEEVVVVSGEVIAAWEEEDDDGVVYSRSWDLGWYRCQKRAAINGSVVRYWAAAGDEATSPSGMSFRRRF